MKILTWKENLLQFPFMILTVLFHVDSYNEFKSIISTRGGQMILLLMAILAYLFLIMYQQDMLSSIVEPILETMPDTFEEIRTRDQRVYQLGHFPLFYINEDVNQHLLKTEYAVTTPGLFALFNRIAKDPNFFIMLYKRTFLDEIANPSLSLMQNFDEWLFRLSEKEIGNFALIYIARKYEPWVQLFNLLVLKIIEGDLLMPSRPRKQFNYNKNPHKDTDELVAYATMKQVHFTSAFLATWGFWAIATLILVMENRFKRQKASNLNQRRKRIQKPSRYSR